MSDYVSRYHVELPEALVSHMRERGWKAPTDEKSILSGWLYREQYVRGKRDIPGSHMTKLERTYHPDGTLATEVTLVDGLPHGMSRSWHPNGTLASETPCTHGLVHGVVRQWNAEGQLLGSYEMINGTGTSCLWYENGQLQAELSTVNGDFAGRQHTYSEDGELLAEIYWLKNKKVSRKRYYEAAARDASLPRYEDGPRPIRRREQSMRKSRRPSKPSESPGEMDELPKQLLAGEQVREARAWLTEPAQGSRSLGEATGQTESLRLVNKLYGLGAVAVHAVEIDGRHDEDQNASYLVLELPEDNAQRKRILAFCGRLAGRIGYDKDPDVGQKYALLKMD